MDFSPDIKAKMFVRCARICCLCYKQCGTNIEVAHIIAKSNGGSNEEDNGISVCFDCHQEIGAYDTNHPKGNKFIPAELKARRDQLYELVEKGLLQALIIVGGLHKNSTQQLPASTSITKHNPGKRAEVLCNATIDGKNLESFPLKLRLLSGTDQAYIMDTLLDLSEQLPALTALTTALSQDSDGERALVGFEQLLTRVTLSPSASVKATFMSFARPELLAMTAEELRLAFFTDVVVMMEENQYENVNLVTPAVVKVQTAVPAKIETRYARALFQQARSGAFRGEPAAKTALKSLPANVAKALLASLDTGDFAMYDTYGRDEWLKQLISSYKALWPKEREEMFNDYITLSQVNFCKKWEW